MNDPRIIPCTHCGSEGRILVRCIGYEPGCGHAHMWGERDDGECPVCEGTGGEIIETEPVDLDDMNCRHCGVSINPMLFPCAAQDCPQRDSW